MKPVPFDYHLPRSVDEALELLRGPRPRPVPLAGGQSLVPLLNLRAVRPTAVLDLNRVPGLDGIEIGERGVRVGAMTRLSTLEHSAPLAEALPVLPATAARVAHPQIRHRATLGGTLCQADPAGQLSTVALALGAELTLRSVSGTRTVAATEFFTGAGTTALRAGELLTGITFPRDPLARHHFTSVTRRGGGGLPLAGLCATVVLDGTVATRLTLAASGVADRPLRLYAAERALTGAHLRPAHPDGTGARTGGGIRTGTGTDAGATHADRGASPLVRDPFDFVPDPARAAEVRAALDADTDPPSDQHGDAAYRAHLLRVLLRRALTALTAPTPDGGPR
ncbi:FAD binding domain-containing protein [Streptomyces sp. NPDC057638]|uniref:FAD binding domain-containing protein n=1 Tax=Streptomyces sp. NPDC057638 TaxID=3346190 RepID=UPI00369C489F